jgi:hypothetical protein
MCPALAFGAEPLLPNLVADPPNNVTLETSSTEGGLKSSGEPKLLLRFNGYIHNVGPGALEFRGYRNSPSEPMKAFQRVYNSDGSYREEPSSAELVYATADGHEHWHLQRAAKYSLWNSARTAEAAPAQKVGFCLDDSEHVDPFGPGEAVYSEANGREFCRQHQPEATRLFEGISVGWRDRYDASLAFQWVDASSVLPGEYWLREDVNPTGVIKETGGPNQPTYATSHTIIPGFDALAQAPGTPAGKPVAITLTSQPWNDSATPKYTIVSGPQHGTLSTLVKNQLTYTPEAGYYGFDSFTFSAADPHSEFPRSPAVATVAIESGTGEPASVAIQGAPSSMIAGTSVQLSALVTRDSHPVTWSASAGSISAGGLYTAPSAPPTGGTVIVTAHTSRGAHDQATISILPVPAPESRPAAPLALSSPPPVIYPPHVILVGRRLLMTTRVSRAGRVRLSAYLGRHLLGTCVARTPANRNFTCRVTLDENIRLNARIGVLASLRIGRTVFMSVRRAAPVPRMRMTGSRPLHGHTAAAASLQFWCTPCLATSLPAHAGLSRAQA